MKRFGKWFRLDQVTAVGLLAGLLVWEPAPLQAQTRNFFTLRRSMGLAFMGGSMALAYKGWDFKQSADDLYARYKKTADPVEADRLYERTTNRDVKSQVSWALAAGFAISGLRLLVTGEAETPEREPESASKQSVLPGLKVVPKLDRLQAGVQLRREFY